MLLSKKLVIHLFGKKQINQNFNFNDVKSILIRPLGDAVGDAIACVGHVQQLKNIYPDSRIGILVTNRNRAVFSLSPLIDELIDDTHINNLKNRKKWDVLLDFYEQFTSKNIIFDFILSPKMSMIFKRKEKEYYNFKNIHNYDFHCPPKENSHISDYLESSEFSKYHTIEKGKFYLPNQEELAIQASSFWEQNSDTHVKILLAPQGSYWKRNIPPQELAELLNSCQKEALNKAQFIMCNTGNCEIYLHELNKLLHKDIHIKLSPKTTLKQYIALVASANITICVDSGTVHLSCALNRPILSFYANYPENIHLWHPKPNEGIPNLMVVSSSTIESRETHHFPLEKAIYWLEKQIIDQSE